MMSEEGKTATAEQLTHVLDRTDHPWLTYLVNRKIAENHFRGDHHETYHTGKPDS